jgi:hypothetical protein
MDRQFTNITKFFKINITESKMVVARGRGEGGMGIILFTG